MNQVQLTKLGARISEKEQEYKELVARYPKGTVWETGDLRSAKNLLEDIKLMSENLESGQTELRGNFHTAIKDDGSGDAPEIRTAIRSVRNGASYEENKKSYYAGLFFLSQNGDIDPITKRQYEEKWSGHYGTNIDQLKLEARALSESVNSAGGFLTPQLLEDSIIAFRAKVGIARNHCQVVNMGSDQVGFPKRNGGITIGFQSENQNSATAQPTFNNVLLNAKTAMGLTSLSNQLNEDSIIDLGNYFIQEFGYSLGYLEDNCLFNGNGTSTLPTLGLSASMAAVASNQSIYSAPVGSKNAWSNITPASLLSFLGALAPYAGAKPEIYCSQLFYTSVLLASAINGGLGGNTLLTFQSGIGNVADASYVRSWMGYPVNVTYLLPSAVLSSSAAQNVMYFGDMSQAVMFGNRANPVFASTNVGGNSFQANQTYWRVIERFDIVPHSVGNILLPDGTTTISAPLITMQTA